MTRHEEGDVEVVRTLVHAFLYSEAKPDCGYMATRAAECYARDTCDNRRSRYGEGGNKMFPLVFEPDGW